MIIKIDDAAQQLLRDYAYYVEAKIDIKEIPLDFEQWQDFNNSSNDECPHLADNIVRLPD